MFSQDVNHMNLKGGMDITQSLKTSAKPALPEAPKVNPERHEYESMEFYNMDAHRRKGQDAVDRKYAKQSGGSKSSMLVNESSGAGGGSGGSGGYSGSQEEQEDRAEFSESQSDSVSETKVKQFAKGGAQYPALSLNDCMNLSCRFAQAFMPFSVPLSFN